MKDLELYLNEVGKRIMERRKKLGMTQEALAEKGEVTTHPVILFSFVCFLYSPRFLPHGFTVSAVN